jgi:hypothetical protein
LARKYVYPDRSTVWLRKSTVEALRRLGGGKETYDQVITKLLNIAEGEVEVYVDFLTVDGDDARNHEILFRLGDYIYLYRKGSFELFRQPKRLPEKLEKLLSKEGKP